MAGNELEALDNGQATATTPGDHEASDFFDGNEQELPEPEADDEVESLDDEIDADDQEDVAEGEDGEVDEPEAKFAEIEIDGKKYQVPEDLKDGYLMQADYTRKTQETAEIRRQLEARQGEVDQLMETTYQEMNVKAFLMNVDQQLEQYRQTDWKALEAEDPLGADSHFRQYQLLKEQREEAVNALGSMTESRKQQLESMTNQRLAETRDFAEKNIPGWNEEVDTKLTSFAVENGFPRETLSQALTPQVYNMLYKAWVGDQTLKRQTAAKSKTGTPVKPSQKVSSKGNPTAQKSLEELPMNEFAALRNKQEKAKAARSR
jgi:hypothetical protein